MEIGIHFGAFADEIHLQIEKLGLKYDAKEVESFQKMADSIFLLSFHDLIVPASAQKARSKLFKRVESHVCKINKLKKVKGSTTKQS